MKIVGQAMVSGIGALVITRCMEPFWFALVLCFLWGIGVAELAVGKDGKS